MPCICHSFQPYVGTSVALNVKFDGTPCTGRGIEVAPLPTSFPSAIAMTTALRHRPGIRQSIVPIGLTLAAFAPLATPLNAQQIRPSARSADSASDRLNLDFERGGVIAPDRPMAWYVGGNGYRVQLDTAVRFSGARSLRSQHVGSLNVLTGAPPAWPPGLFGVATISMPGGAPVGKTVRLSGHMRTKDITRGYAGLWLRVDGTSNRTLFLDNMSKRGVTGTTLWTRYEITVRVDSAAVGIVFGALHPGDGTAWFDALSIEVDGKPFEENRNVIAPASEAEVAWVREHASRLTTSDPRAPLNDLRPVGDIVGNARIVALGEGTHGTREFFQMKHRITNYLAEEKGFTVFAIEANMPEARRVNEYVLTGRGDPRAALAGMYFWTWNTQEVLDMIEWMRAYNASGKGRMEFWGFDMQTPDVAMDSVRDFVRREDPAYVARLDSAYAGIADIVRAQNTGARNLAGAAAWEQNATRVLQHLESSRDRYVAGGRDTLSVAWAIQNARIVVQAARSTRSGGATRDSSMAENVAWIAAHQPAGTRMVLWAHNGHVNRNAGFMGGHLDQRYGDDQRVFGFGFSEGEYTAIGPRGLSHYPATPPEPSATESAFRATRIPRFVLDLRRAASQPNARWLGSSRDFRSIGSMATDGGFYPVRLTALYDAIIYIDQTTPSVPLVNRR